MAAMIRALDKQFGENGHLEYSWSNEIREKIVQFSFQLTRTDEKTVEKLRFHLKNILITLNQQKIHENMYYLSLLYRMIGYTRDIVDGKGEYLLSYMMIFTWYEYFPELSYFALSCFVNLDEKTHPYGSWKDIKYFCEYCIDHGLTIENPLIQYAISLMNDQLRKDSSSKDISLVSKWIPREKSAFGFLYEALATNYYPEYMCSAKTVFSKRGAIVKCKTNYRKLISTLNAKLDTVQIKQCNKDWSRIEFNNVTSITLGKQKKAFLNIKKNGIIRYSDIDRIECADHFIEHVTKGVNGEIQIKGKRVGMQDFTKQALNIIAMKFKYDQIPREIQTQIDLLNSQWNDNSTQTNVLGNFIAMVDVSGSMEGDPKYVSTALGIRVAEKSKLGKRVMTFSSHPSWVNLEPHSDFVSMVGAICTDSGLNTNFYAALDLILDAIIESKLSPEEVENMILAIFSDMQVDAADNSDKQTMFTKIEAKYVAAGNRLYGKPFNVPHILMWNLRSTDGFPCLSSEKNVSMMSGFSPSLLNLFCDKGIDALQSCTPWSMLVQSLENKRYVIMEDKLKETIKEIQKNIK